DACTRCCVSGSPQPFFGLGRVCRSNAGVPPRLASKQDGPEARGPIQPPSTRNCQADQRVGGAVKGVEVAAGIDQPVVLRFGNRETGRDRPDAAYLFLE